MKNRRDTIRKIVDKLNNREEEGGFWLPNIQRPFVWGEDRICRLYDSIMREYPISTLLVWKTKGAIRRRTFIDNWRDGMRLSEYYVPEDAHRKCRVLDGQQRLQSLYIGLYGSFNGRELYLNILSGDLVAPDDIKYKFAFLDASNAPFPWVKVKELVFTDKSTRQLGKVLEELATEALTPEQKDRLDDNLETIARTFRIDETVTYQELDSIDSPDLYREDDVVEIFIRANSGGTPLGKSDLLFSLLAASWDTADKAMDDLLDDLNQHGYGFTRDFVLKTCLSLLDQGARHDVSKFRKTAVKEHIEVKWASIADALRDVQDFLYGKTFIKCDKAIPSYLALIPLVYLRFHFPDAWKQAAKVDTFLLRTLLTGVFGLAPDQLIDACVRKIREVKGFDLKEMFGVIQSTGRSLRLAEDRFWGMGYDSDNIHLLFNLWYKDFNYTPAYENNRPQIDHIFPKSRLREIKLSNPETGHLTLMKYKRAEQNQLGNCMLLTAEENGAGGKSDTPPDEWFADKSKDYLAMHLIPDDPALWKMDRFDDFLAARKELLRQKFAFLLVQESAGP